MLPTPLVPPEALRGRLHEVLACDVRPGPAGRAAHAAEHLAGALYVDLDADLSAPATHPERGGRHPLPTLADFAALLGRLGVTPDTFVLAYDAAGGGLAAARLWWMLRAVGHTRVAVLDGGLAAARAAGLALDAAPTAPTPAPPYPVPATWALPLVDADAVEALRQDPTRRLVDVRAAARFRGEVEPIDPIAGHIPGAVNLPYEESLGADGRFLPPAALRARIAAVIGDLPPDAIVASCGSGVTACHLLLAMEHLGLPGAALYVGSWGEWCRSGRPRDPA